MRPIEERLQDTANIEAELVAQSDEELTDGLARCLSHVEHCKRMRDRARSNVVSLEADVAGRRPTVTAFILVWGSIGVVILASLGWLPWGVGEAVAFFVLICLLWNALASTSAAKRAAECAAKVLPEVREEFESYEEDVDNCVEVNALTRDEIAKRERLAATMAPTQSVINL